MEARERERGERGKSRGLWWREEFVVAADVEGLFSCDMQRKLPAHCSSQQYGTRSGNAK